jgi:elongator complex protein 3
MATATMTMPPPASTKSKNSAKLPPENERYMRACSDIANVLIQEYESQTDPTKPKKDINLNKLRGQIAKKHSLAAQPPLTAIIAAVPEHYKKYILPKLIAKPIRMFPSLRSRLRWKVL